MAAASLLYFADRAAGKPGTPLADLSLTPALLDTLRKYHVRQFWPRPAFVTAWDWAGSGGGRPEGVLGRLRLAGTSPDPHVLCFGPALTRRLLSCFARAHAIVLYRIEEGRLYVYEPSHPGDRGRFVEFRRDSGNVEFA